MRDRELIKIAGAMKRLDELTEFIGTGLTSEQQDRVMRYVADRYGWLFKWFENKKQL